MLEVPWPALAAVCASVMATLAVFGFWMRFSDRVTKAETSAQASSILSAGLQVKLDGIQKELSDYKAEAARIYVSDKDLIQVEQRFARLVEEIKQDIRGVNERLDRVLDAPRA